MGCIIIPRKVHMYTTLHTWRKERYPRFQHPYSPKQNSVCFMKSWTQHMQFLRHYYNNVHHNLHASMHHCKSKGVSAVVTWSYLAQYTHSIPVVLYLEWFLWQDMDKQCMCMSIVSTRMQVKLITVVRKSTSHVLLSSEIESYTHTHTHTYYYHTSPESNTIFTSTTI